MTSSSNKLLVTVAEAADMLAVSPKTVYELAAAGEFTKRYVGRGTRAFRLEVDEIRDYIQRLPTEPRTSS